MAKAIPRTVPHAPYFGVTAAGARATMKGMRRRIRQTALATAFALVGLSIAVPGAVRGEPQCTCRYAGQSYALEACVCLATPGGARMACCGQVLNNSSWTFTGDGCPVAAAPADDQDQYRAALRRAVDAHARF